MGINLQGLKAAINANKTRRAAAGQVNFLKAGTTNLRILPFLPAGAEFTEFARPWHSFVIDKKTDIVDRLQTFGAACVATKLEEMADAAGEASPFLRRRTQYLVNGILLDGKGSGEVKIWQIPTSIWEEIGTYLLNTEWENILDQHEGHSFAITKTGEQLSTEYSMTISRKAVPVTDAQMAKVRDPYTVKTDPGLAGQAELLKVELDSVFPDLGELENVEPIDFSGGGAEVAKQEAPQTVKGCPFKTGDKVKTEINGETAVYTVETVISPVTLHVKDAAGDVYEVAVSDCTRAAPPAAKPIIKPAVAVVKPAKGPAKAAKAVKEQETRENLDRLMVGVGDKVTVDIGGVDYPGTVTEVPPLDHDLTDETEISIAYDDGDAGTAALKFITVVERATPEPGNEEATSQEGDENLPFAPTKSPVKGAPPKKPIASKSAVQPGAAAAGAVSRLIGKVNRK